MKSPKPVVRKKHPIVGDFCHVLFVDHVEDSYDVLEFWVSGRVIKNTSTYLTIASWAYDDLTESVDACGDSNQKLFTIVKSTIKKAIVTPPKLFK